MSDEKLADCLVCKKHRGEVKVPGGAIYEDDLLYASHALIPEGEQETFLGALLVEPKRHAAALEDLTDEEAQAVGLLLARLSRALKAAVGAEHVYLFRFGHHVDHLHLWLLPRYPGTPREYWGIKVDEWPDAPHGGLAEIEALCEKVRQELKRVIEGH